MFSGAWKESSEDVIHIEILDPNINLDGIFLNCNIENLLNVLGFLINIEQPFKLYWDPFIKTNCLSNRQKLCRCLLRRPSYSSMESLTNV